MIKDKQKMTLNVRRRANTDAAATAAPPPAADPLKVAAFAGAIEPPLASDRAAADQTSFTSEPIVQVIRDAFTMPAEDHRLFAEIQQKCLAQGINVSKSEIVRAGLKYIVGLSASDLAAIVKTVPKVKIGRPADKYKKSKQFK